MRISILTLFPEVFSEIFSSSILKRAQEKKIVEYHIVNIREFATDKHKTVDDKPYGGGVGMLMRVDVVEKAIKNTRLKNKKRNYKEKVILLDPKGETFNQKMAEKFTRLDHLILICGHYEGIDARINNFVDEVITVGEFILTGGEIPAMLIVDTLVRLIPGVLVKKEAIKNETFSKKSKFEAPQYTRPFSYKGYSVPKILLSGNHKKISQWKAKQSSKMKDKKSLE